LKNNCKNHLLLFYMSNLLQHIVQQQDILANCQLLFANLS